MPRAASGQEIFHNLEMALSSKASSSLGDAQSLSGVSVSSSKSEHSTILRTIHRFLLVLPHQLSSLPVLLIHHQPPQMLYE